ncbi:MAG: hypothetical protein U0736_03855 [Gemmataceae bacterium]
MTTAQLADRRRLLDQVDRFRRAGDATAGMDDTAASTCSPPASCSKR